MFAKKPHERGSWDCGSQLRGDRLRTLRQGSWRKQCGVTVVSKMFRALPVASSRRSCIARTAANRTQRQRPWRILSTKLPATPHHWITSTLPGSTPLGPTTSKQPKVCWLRLAPIPRKWRRRIPFRRTSTGRSILRRICRLDTMPRTHRLRKTQRRVLAKCEETPSRGR